MEKKINNNVNEEASVVAFNDATGEIVSSFKGFRSMWSNPYGCETQDLSNQFEDTFTELAPFAVDPETKEIINNSSVPKVVFTGKVNVYEKIQSYRKEVDLYSILEKFAYSGDTSLLNVRQCAYGDISDLPDNLNDYARYVDIHFKKLAEMNPELAKQVLDDNLSAEDIENNANDILNKRVEALNASKDNDDNGGK